MINTILIKYGKSLAILWTIFVLILCSFPGKYIPVISWLEILSFDKWVHLTIFYILTFLWLNTFFVQEKWNRLNKLLIVIFCVLYGGILEYLQSIVFSHRSADYLDFIANSIGCLLAYLSFKIINQMVFKIQKQN